MAVVMSVTEDAFCQIGTSEGVLKQLYARSQFSLCPKNLLRIKGSPDDEISLRSVAVAQFSGNSQGFVKCICKTKCQNMKGLHSSINLIKIKLNMSFRFTMLQQTC